MNTQCRQHVDILIRLPAEAWPVVLEQTSYVPSGTTPTQTELIHI